jgi:hypothetical protein
MMFFSRGNLAKCGGSEEKTKQEATEKTEK